AEGVRRGKRRRRRRPGLRPEDVRDDGQLLADAGGGEAVSPSGRADEQPAEDRLLEDAEEGVVEPHPDREGSGSRDGQAEERARRTSRDPRERQHRLAADGGGVDRRIPGPGGADRPRSGTDDVRGSPEDDRSEADPVAPIPQRNAVQRL